MSLDTVHNLQDADASSALRRSLTAPVKKVAHFLVSPKLLGEGSFGKVYEGLFQQSRSL